MDHILNELSLTGQFQSVDDFVREGALPLADVLADIAKFGGSLLYKKSDFYQCNALPNMTFFDLVIAGTPARTNDSLRKLKSKLALLMNEPHWDLNPQQDEKAIYLMVDNSGKEIDVSGTSVAEALVRKACLVSFAKSAFVQTPINVKEKTENTYYNVENVWQSGQVCDILQKAGLLSIEDYIIGKYSGKLDFSRIDAKNGFSLIDSSNLSIFESGFRKFNELPWSRIPMDDALDYKEFHYNANTKRFFHKEIWNKGVRKFRITQEIRCFGYVEGGTFYVLRFDLDHILSDLG